MEPPTREAPFSPASEKPRTPAAEKATPPTKAPSPSREDAAPSCADREDPVDRSHRTVFKPTPPPIPTPTRPVALATRRETDASEPPTPAPPACASQPSASRDGAAAAASSARLDAALKRPRTIPADHYLPQFASSPSVSSAVDTSQSRAAGLLAHSPARLVSGDGAVAASSARADNLLQEPQPRPAAPPVGSPGPSASRDGALPKRVDLPPKKVRGAAPLVPPPTFAPGPSAGSHLLAGPSDVEIDAFTAISSRRSGLPSSAGGPFARGGTGSPTSPPEPDPLLHEICLPDVLEVVVEPQGGPAENSRDVRDMQRASSPSYESHIDPCVCYICYDRLPNAAARTTTSCGHTFCTVCMMAHVCFAGEENQYPIYCPLCSTTVDSSACLSLLDRSLPAYAALERLIIEHEHHERIRYCSNERCSVPFDWLEAPSSCKEAEKHKVTCPLCSVTTCGNCRTAWHEGMSCDGLVVERNKTDPLQLLASSNSWRNCPHCGHLIERLTGCDTVTCICRRQFCYLCGLESCLYDAHSCVLDEGEDVSGPAQPDNDLDMSPPVLQRLQTPAPRERMHNDTFLSEQVETSMRLRSDVEESRTFACPHAGCSSRFRHRSSRSRHRRAVHRR